MADDNWRIRLAAACGGANPSQKVEVAVGDLRQALQMIESLQRQIDKSRAQ